MKKFTLILTAVVTLFFVAGAQAGSKAINKTCPLSGKAVNPSKVATVKVEFCCNNCKGKFDKAPARFMGKAAKGKDGQCILSGKPAKTSSEVTVAFCCGNCQAKFEKSPKKYLAKLQAKKSK